MAHTPWLFPPATEPCPPTPPIDPAFAGAEARDRAIARVDAHTDEEWLQAAVDAVKRLCAKRETFSTDDVWLALAHAGVRLDGEPRAMGAVMRRAEAAGYVEPLSAWTLSIRPECHRRPVRLWRAR